MTTLVPPSDSGQVVHANVSSALPVPPSDEALVPAPGCPRVPVSPLDPAPMSGDTTGETPIPVAPTDTSHSPWGGNPPGSEIVGVRTQHVGGLQEHVARLGEVRGRELCRTSPMVALKVAALAGGGAFAAGAVAGWFVLHKVSSIVILTDQGVVLALAGGVFALTVAAAVAGYATARWRHARSIPAKGRIGAKGVGFLLALVATVGIAAAFAPWSFPSANVLAVSPLALGLYLAQGEVVGGLVVYSKDNEAIAYLKTNRDQWVAATIPRSAVAVVDQDIASGITFPQGEIARAVGDGQQAALRADRERLWLWVGAMAVWAAAVGVVQRHRWRNAPWPAPVAGDTLRSMVRFYAQQP